MLQGDFSKLDKLVKQVGALTGSKMELHQRLALDAQREINRGFRTATAPDGTPWAPLKLRSGRPLQDRGLLKNSLVPVATADGFTVATDRKGATVHQYGATIVPKQARVLRFPAGAGRAKRWIFAKRVVVPARPFLPMGELPESWRKSFERVLARWLRDRMKP